MAAWLSWGSFQNSDLSTESTPVWENQDEHNDVEFWSEPEFSVIFDSQSSKRISLVTKKKLISIKGCLR